VRIDTGSALHRIDFVKKKKKKKGHGGVSMISFKVKQALMIITLTYIPGRGNM
jgi:hypothetical protein